MAERTESMGYDIIGDIHGQADKLEALLRTIGYRELGRRVASHRAAGDLRRGLHLTLFGTV